MEKCGCCLNQNEVRKQNQKPKWNRKPNEIINLKKKIAKPKTKKEITNRTIANDKKGGSAGDGESCKCRCPPLASVQPMKKMVCEKEE